MIKTKLATGKAPDIYCVDSGTTPEVEYYVSKNCVDLTNQEWVNCIEKAALKIVSSNGKVYGITFSGYKVY
jgi:raffinose/stachyose/melibiose transport system substrate-binding protein